MPPWHTNADVLKHNKKAGKSKAHARLWRDVANRSLRQHGDEGRAIREANAVVRNR